MQCRAHLCFQSDLLHEGKTRTRAFFQICAYFFTFSVYRVKGQAHADISLLFWTSERGPHKAPVHWPQAVSDVKVGRGVLH